MKKIETFPVSPEQGEVEPSGFSREVWSGIKGRLDEAIGQEVTAEWDDAEGPGNITVKDARNIRGEVDSLVADAMEYIGYDEESMDWIAQNEKTGDEAGANYLAELITDKYLSPAGDLDDTVVAA